MRIGIIAEGKSDIAVITNILKGKLGIDRSDLSFLLPELEYDETDRYHMREEQFSNWTLVKKLCEDKTKITDFIEPFAEERFIVIQIDTAEAHLYGIEKPEKKDNPSYSSDLRNQIVSLINEWLGNQFEESVFYAVTIEETEAWVLTIYDEQQQETATYNDPKRKLSEVLHRKLTGKSRKILTYDPLQKYDELTRDFRKLKNLSRYVHRNESLKLFCESIDRIIVQ